MSVFGRHGRREQLHRAGAAGVVVSVVAACVAAWSCPAYAATSGRVSVTATGKATFVAADGKVNSLKVSYAGGRLTLDDSVRIIAGKGCSPVTGDVTRVTCKIGTKPATPALVAWLGNGSDRLTVDAALVAEAHGGTGNDTLTGSNTAADRLYGDSGRDIASGRGGNDTISGGTGNDSLYGGTGIDGLSGDTGDDTLSGGAGNDRVTGGAGDDRLGAGDGDDVVNGGAGFDIITGGAGDDAIDGAAGGDDLYGGTGTDTLDYSNRTHDLYVALDGSRTLWGHGEEGRESDRLAADFEIVLGGSGNDLLRGENSATLVRAGAGDDEVVCNLGCTVHAGAGNDRIFMGRPSVVWGGTGDDTINGSSGDDVLHGEEGDDWLWAGRGADQLHGGPGDDELFGWDGDDVLDGGTGRNTITRS